MSGWSVAVAQTKPASSRAMATTIVRSSLPRLAACSSAGGGAVRRAGARDGERVLVARRRGMRVAGARAAAVIPGRLDQQPAGVVVAGLGDRALRALSAGGVLAGDQADEAHELPRRSRSARSRRSRPPARRRSACRCPAGSAAARPARRRALQRLLASPCSSGSIRRSTRSSSSGSRRTRPARRAPRRSAGPARCGAGRPRLGRHRAALAEQELAQPAPRAHAVLASVLARPHQIAERLLLGESTGSHAASRPRTAPPSAARHADRS